MEYGYRMFIDPTEFNQKVLDYISSDELDKMVDSTVFKDKPECKNAIIHGMIIASMLTCRCKSIYVKEETKPTCENLVFKTSFSKERESY